MSNPIPNHIREGIESAIVRGRADDLKSTDSYIETKRKFREKIPLWMHDCSRDDFKFYSGITTESFKLPAGEIIMVQQHTSGAKLFVSWWHPTCEKFISADTIDHAIYCSTHETAERLLKQAKLALDAEESA